MYGRQATGIRRSPVPWDPSGVLSDSKRTMLSLSIVREVRRFCGISSGTGQDDVVIEYICFCLTTLALSKLMAWRGVGRDAGDSLEDLGRPLLARTWAMVATDYRRRRLGL